MSEAVRQLEAVLGRRKPAQGVAARDFHQPHRIGPARLGALRLALKNLMPALERKLAESAGLHLRLALGALGEVDADAIFAHTSEPLCVLRFRCQGAPAWLVWDPAAAVATVETLFGARGSASTARKLSPTEVKIASQFLGEIVRSVTGALGLAASDSALVQVASELGSWRDAGVEAGKQTNKETSKDGCAEADSHRFDVRLDVQLGEATSALHLYLPGLGGEAEDTARPGPETLPAHLERVEVELSACLSGCEISLDQLLALEEGDVIPLEARLGDPTTLCVEGLTLARARLGSHRGRLAVRIEHLSVQAEAAA